MLCLGEERCNNKELLTCQAEAEGRSRALTDLAASSH